MHDVFLWRGSAIAGLAIIKRSQVRLPLPAVLLH